MPRVQHSKDQIHREWCSSSLTSEYHKGCSQQGKEIPCSSGYQIKSCQILHETKQLCVQHSAWSNISQPVSLTSRRITLPLPGRSTAVPGSNGGSSGGVWLLPFSWTYLQYFRWSSWVDQQTLQQEWWPDSYFYSSKSSF